jgi:glycolate oxidase FAD binding subunit
MMERVERPADEGALVRLVGEAFAGRSPLAVRGGGSKAGMGGDSTAETVVEVSALSGLTLHEPAELVVAARAGTTLAEIVAALDAKGQMLPFEPPDHRRLFGTVDAEPTIGGIVAHNLSGPRRVSAGACRDSLIGVRFVNGRGESIKSGGRVMKNVTGYDLSKLMAGSRGTLGILTEVVFKVLPKPETMATLAWRGLTEADAIALLSEALCSPYEVAAAAHQGATEDRSRTLLRLENFARSTAYRAEALRRALKRFGAAELIEGASAAEAWTAIRDLTSFVDRDGALWRLSSAPSKAGDLVAGLSGVAEKDTVIDWGGSAIYLRAPETESAAKTIRAEARRHHGHASLFRASPTYREAAKGSLTDAAVTALSERVKAAFDPAGILNPGVSLAL